MKTLRTLGWFKKNYAPNARGERGARKLVTDGLLPHVRVGEEMYFDVDATARWDRKRKRAEARGA